MDKSSKRLTLTANIEASGRKKKGLGRKALILRRRSCVERRDSHGINIA